MPARLAVLFRPVATEAMVPVLFSIPCALLTVVLVQLVVWILNHIGCFIQNYLYVGCTRSRQNLER